MGHGGMEDNRWDGWLGGECSMFNLLWTVSIGDRWPHTQAVEAVPGGLLGWLVLMQGNKQGNQQSFDARCQTVTLPSRS